MYIPFLVIITFLSLFSIGDLISDYILKKRIVLIIIIYVLCLVSFLFLTYPNTIHNTGEISIWLLWVLLYLPILSKVFKLSIPIKLMLFRKEIGVLMGVMAFVHSLQYFIKPYSYMFWELSFWVIRGVPTHLSWGMLGLVIAIILTITSNHWSLKKIGGKTWKLIHKSVYGLIILSLLHVYIFKMGPNFDLKAFFIEFLPLMIYFIGKILQWKGVKVDLKKKITNIIRQRK